MMKFKKISCNLIVLSLLLCSCGKKESLVNNVSSKEKEVKKNEIVESEDVVKLKSELSESQEALKKEKEKTKEVQEVLERAEQRIKFLSVVSAIVPLMMALIMLYYHVPHVLPIALTPAMITFGIHLIIMLM